MKVKRAQHIEIYLCDHCASVHIGLFRGDEMFAEAIPEYPELVLEELKKAIAESQVRQGVIGRRHRR